MQYCTLTGVNSLMKFCTILEMYFWRNRTVSCRKVKFCTFSLFFCEKVQLRKKEIRSVTKFRYPLQTFLSLCYRSLSLTHTQTHSHTNSILISPIYLSLQHTHPPPPPSHKTLFLHSLTFISEWIMVHKPFHSHPQKQKGL